MLVTLLFFLEQILRGYGNVNVFEFFLHFSAVMAVSEMLVYHCYERLGFSCFWVNLNMY